MDKRSADIQAKARLLGVPLTCILCEHMTHSGTEIDVEQPQQESDQMRTLQDAAYFLTCEKQHWHRDARDSNATTFNKLTMASTCEEFSMVQQDWIDITKRRGM